MVSGGKMTKSLHLARAFHAAGHRVVMVETARYRLGAHRYSRAVDAFHVVPAPSHPDYADALARIVRREQVDVYVPVCSPVSSRYDAESSKLLPDHCEVFHVDVDVIDDLDDKYRFATRAAALGLDVPETHLITDPAQVLDFDFPDDGRTWILKSIPYDPVHRLDLTRLPRPTQAETAAHVASLPIGPDRPWILQEFVEGQEFCAHATVRDGTIRVWACCASSPFQVNYEMVDEPDIQAWVEQFVSDLDLTGQVSFDFIRTETGRTVAIECNPRTHSAITMFDDLPALAAAYLDPGSGLLVPHASSRPTYWLHHELWRMLTRPSRIPERLGILRRGRDAVLRGDDPLPFLLLPHLQVPALLVDALRHGREWVRIDFNIGKLVEVGGD